jgi:hypothetical protein
MALLAALSFFTEVPTADFSVIDPYRMMHTEGSAEEATRPIAHAWRARVNISATRCKLREDRRVARDQEGQRVGLKDI